MSSDPTSTDFAALHDELRGVARDLLGKANPDEDVEWRLLAESAWLGLEVPETFDGAGATFAEVAVILEEMGRALTRSPYLGGIVLGVGVLTLLAPCAARDEVLTGAASGTTIAVAALPGTDLDGAPAFRLDPSARLTGHAEFVPDAAAADRLLLLARDASGTPVVIALNPDTDGLTCTPQPVLDATRSLSTVAADGVTVEEAAIWHFADDAEAAVARLADRAALALACDSLGLGAAMLEATVGYAQVRNQFGRPIGSFQAVKHACADMHVHLTIARQLVNAAIEQLVTNDPAARASVSMAKSYTSGAVVDIVGKAMQLHGGIGYTWESGIHAYLKRATLNRALFGAPAAHRKRLAQRYR